MDYPGIKYVLQSRDPAIKTLDCGTIRCSIEKELKKMNNHNYTF